MEALVINVGLWFTVFLAFAWMPAIVIGERLARRKRRQRRQEMGK